MRVALCADSFHETNGVALTCRQLEDFARRRELPMLSIHAGERTARFALGSVERFELGPSGWSLGLEQDLSFDLRFWRHAGEVRRAMERFRPDVVHVTGPNHAGLLGMMAAHRLKIPVVASWHTNLHEYLARRAGFARGSIEAATLWLLGRYYGLGRVLLAPNAELAEMLEGRTGRRCRIMRRGVDSERFAPRRRARGDAALVVGYVGRLSVEKSVRRLAGIERALAAAGVENFRIEIAGHGAERGWLKENVARLRDHGLLTGCGLAAAYAGFDIFVFPSETDTYGNVVQEAMASGVACVVMGRGGPAHIVTDGRDGLVARSAEEMERAVVELAVDAGRRAELGREARRTALGASWDAVFERVYEAYGEAVGGVELQDGGDERGVPGVGVCGGELAARVGGDGAGGRG